MDRKRVRLALGWYHHFYHRGVARFAHEANGHLWSAQRLHTVIHKGWTGDGFITNGLFPEEWHILGALDRTAVVTLDTDIWADRAGQVVSDHEAVGRVAFEHFRRRGYGSFA